MCCLVGWILRQLYICSLFILSHETPDFLSNAGRHLVFVLHIFSLSVTLSFLFTGEVLRKGLKALGKDLVKIFLFSR